ncbi:MAG: dethiobiotin synthase [Nitrospirales bacterium]|nr:dethiobiotin synthase [Nitrospirales bacterium]
MNAPFFSRALFITGTDTGVGKTLLTGTLLVALQQQGRKIGIFKPVETGIHPLREAQSDSARLRRLCSSNPSPDSICLYRYEPPLSPLACSRLLAKPIDCMKILRHSQVLAQQHELTLIEGAGGLLTPLTFTHTMLDLLVTLQIPCMIVSRTDLGAINHALLTLRTLKQTGISTHALVLNEPSSANGAASLQRASTIELIRELASVPVYGPIGFESTLASNWETGVHQLAGHQEIQRLIRSLTRKGL